MNFIGTLISAASLILGIFKYFHDREGVRSLRFWQNAYSERFDNYVKDPNSKISLDRMTEARSKVDSIVASRSLGLTGQSVLCWITCVSFFGIAIILTVPVSTWLGGLGIAIVVTLYLVGLYFECVALGVISLNKEFRDLFEALGDDSASSKMRKDPGSLAREYLQWCKYRRKCRKFSEHINFRIGVSCVHCGKRGYINPLDDLGLIPLMEAKKSERMRWPAQWAEWYVSLRTNELPFGVERFIEDTRGTGHFKAGSRAEP